MLLWATSKEFEKYFLKNEKDKIILDMQYVICSLRIRKREEHDNIISAQSILFPNPDVCSAITQEDMRERYYDQLMCCKPFLATLIKGAIEENYNILFLCSKNEGKMKFLQYLAEFVYLEFDYPVYNYKRFAEGSCALIKYKEKKVLKKCNYILDNVKKQSYIKNVQTEAGRKSIMKEYKKMKKSELKKDLKKRNLYAKGMTKEDMLDTIELFLW